MEQPVRIDFETRSTVELKRTGVYPYAAHPDTGIWCMAYAFGDEDVQLWRPDLPVDQRLADHIASGGQLMAWNAQFERVMWQLMLQYGWPGPSLEQWHCSMALAASWGLPMSLDMACQALGTGHQKDKDGHNLMMRMCRPRRIEDDGTLVWWEDADKLLRLGEYCMQDVRTERDISKLLGVFLPERERRIWLFDQRVNDRGVGLDHELAVMAEQCADLAVERANEELDGLTGGAVELTKPATFVSWLNANGMTAAGVARPMVTDMLKRPSSDTVERVLKIRQESGKSSVAKYHTMLEVAHHGRMHGLLQYHAAHTGRWAGRLVQPHNFPRGTVKGVEHYIPFVKSGDAAAIDCMHPVMEVLSSMLRSAMVAAENHTLFTADFAAIEARVLAWLAGETGLLDDFRNGVDTYRGLAADIYGVPKESIAKTSQMRLVGKQAVLGLGYQMGASKFVDSCKTTYDLDIPADLAKLTVNTYRAKYKEIARMWAALEAAVVRAVSEPGTFVKLRQCDVSFQVLGEWMYCTLPSGRQLHYHRPMVAEVELPWSTPERPALKDQVSVMGLDSYTHKWTRYALYGGLLTENIVQAVSRDILAEAMFRVEEAGYPVVLTVHDEVVSERKKGTGSLSEFEGLMRVVPEWAAGCPVDVEGWTGARYRK